MSLINQMLQDLDARRAAHGVGTRLPNDVRPLPKAPSSSWPLGIALGVGLFIVIGLGFVWRDDLAGVDRLRVVVNALMRLRFCTPEGRMEFKTKVGNAAAAPAGRAAADRCTAGTRTSH